MGESFFKPPSDISNSNEKRMVEEKGDACWRFVSSCFVLGCERHHAHPLRDGGAYRWGAL